MKVRAALVWQALGGTYLKVVGHEDITELWRMVPGILPYDPSSVHPTLISFPSTNPYLWLGNRCFPPVRI